MSGRLTILPKKSYCPWSDRNVERVLRDERLERERLEREEREVRAAAHDRRRGDGGGVGGHVNLFPEAEEAELRLATGRGAGPGGTGAKDRDASAAAAGVVPVPLGGNEAARRRAGAVPFYMRPQNTGEARKYENATSGLGLGNRTAGRGGAVPADEITGEIMRDQYEKREDGRKDRMDPMGRFVGAAPSKDGGRTSSLPHRTKRDVQSSNGGPPRAGKSKDGSRHGQNFRRKRPRRLYDRGHGSSNDSDSNASHSSSSSRSSSGSNNPTVVRPGKAGRRKNRRRSRKGHKYDPHGRKKPRPHSLGRIRHEKSRKGHREESRGKSRSGADMDLEELRMRRRAREAREAERERRVTHLAAAPGAFGGSGLSHSGGRGGYYDQFNPSLSRN